MKKIKFLLILLITSIINSYGQHTVTIKKGDDKNFTYFTIQGDTTKYKFKATVADYEARFEDAANFTVKAIEKDEYKPEKIQNGYYDAACYFTLVNISDKAIKYMLESVNNGWEDLAQLEYDADLQPLKETEDWKIKIEPTLKDYYKTNNRVLAKMFTEDQKPRFNRQIDTNLAKQDSIRRKEVVSMIKNDELKSGHDYYKAAMIMHHGNTIEDYMLAEKLIQKSLTVQQIHIMGTSNLIILTTHIG